MRGRMPAEVFPPGEFLREELEARGWAQLDLAEITGSDPRTISEIITYKRSVTPETAKMLGEAFETGPAFWMNLQSIYDLHKVDAESGQIAKRAQLFTRAPIRELVKRGWIEGAENPEVLEKQLLNFFETDNLEQVPQLWSYAPRQSTSYKDVTPAQWAWLVRARKIARCLTASPFTKTRLKAALKKLKSCAENEEDVRQVSKILSEGGVRLVIVEPLKGTKIDGACFWLDRKSPVIALSLRYDRIDYFWYTLMHEIGHVMNRDGLQGEAVPLDIDLVGKDARKEDKPRAEKEVDQFAANSLIEKEELDDFVSRTRPLYSKLRIRNFAKRLRIHPGIVVGQLQHRDQISYAHSRNLLAPVREVIVHSALTDGWGFDPLKNI